MNARYQRWSDEKLLLRSVNGSAAPFEELVRRYEGRLYRFIFRMIGDAEEAEDLFQQTCLRAYRKRHTFRKESRFSTWVYTIAANCCRDELRRRGRHPVEAEEDMEPAARESRFQDSIHAGPDHSAFSREIAMKVEDAMASLNTTQRTLIVLAHFEGLDYQAIADVLGCSMGTVKSGLHRARQNLRVLLEGVDAENADSSVCEETLHELL